MSAYWSPYYFKPVPKRAFGRIHLHKSGKEISNTWWGQRWIKALESFGWHTRTGQVISIKIKPGLVLAEVQGSRSSPYKTKIALRLFSSKDRSLVADELSRKAIYSAKLLAGEMPAGIEAAFHRAKLPLFPRSRRDLATDCTCPDIKNPCKHIAAVYYILAQEFDRDPFLLFKLRGMDRDALLAEIRSKRRVQSNVENPDEPSPIALKASPKKSQNKLKSINILKHMDNFYSLRSKLPNNIGELGSLMHQEFPNPGGKIIELGAPPFWRGEIPFQETLTSIYQTVQTHALNSLTRILQ